MVGMFALGSGIFGVNALGMGIMAGIVAVGVVKGELDPSPGVSTVLPWTIKVNMPPQV